MHRGFVKLYRKIIEWTWFKDHTTLATFIYLLVKSNHKETNFMGYPIPRGSCVCGRFALAHAIGTSERSVRTALKHLKATNEVTIKATNHFSIISIVNFDIYQDKATSKTTNEVTIQRPASDQQVTTSKECKELKNEKKEREATPQSLEEAKAFFKSLGFESYSEEFFDFYASKGWVVGRSPMKDWKSAARRWCRNQKNYGQSNQSKPQTGLDAILERVRKEKENAKLYA